MNSQHQEFVDVDQLIDEVKSRQCLWNIANTAYNDRVLKQQEWHDVAGKLFEKWVDLTFREKQRKVDVLLKKWKSLRDYYVRFRRKAKKDFDFYNFRGNHYFKKMTFLDARRPDLDDSLDQRIIDDSEPIFIEVPKNSSGEIEENEIEVIHDDVELVESETEIEPEPKKRKIVSLEKFLSEKKEMSANELFLMSFAPEMDRMTEDQNFKFRMELMNVLNNIKYNLPAK